MLDFKIFLVYLEKTLSEKTKCEHLVLQLQGNWKNTNYRGVFLTIPQEFSCFYVLRFILLLCRWKKERNNLQTGTTAAIRNWMHLQSILYFFQFCKIWRSVMLVCMYTNVKSICILCLTSCLCLTGTQKQLKALYLTCTSMLIYLTSALHKFLRAAEMSVFLGLALLSQIQHYFQSGECLYIFSPLSELWCSADLKANSRLFRLSLLHPSLTPASPYPSYLGQSLM